MNKADNYIKEQIENILAYGYKDENPRPKYADGPVHRWILRSALFSSVQRLRRTYLFPSAPSAHPAWPA